MICSQFLLLSSLWLVSFLAQQADPSSRTIRFTKPHSIMTGLVIALQIATCILAYSQHIQARDLPYKISLPAMEPPPGAPLDRPLPELNILNSTQSLTGRVMVADNLEYGYRFLRCDHSLLGGRWVRLDHHGKADAFGDS